MSTLEIGTVVGYSDMANPWQTAVVVDEPNDYGRQTVVFEDGHTSQLYRGSIEGPGGWRRVGDKKVSLEEVEDRKKAANAYRDEQDRRHNELHDRINRNREILKSVTPEGCSYVVVAEYKEDRSNSMIDYYGTTTAQVVVLGFSKHGRRLFSEMRKFAAVSDIEEVRMLAAKNTEFEHREDYTGGGGLYLKDGPRYSTGWSIHKRSIRSLGCHNLDMDRLNKSFSAEKVN